MGTLDDLKITIDNGQVIISYPDGTSDRTGIYPNRTEAALVKQFGLTTTGRSMLMRMRNKEVLDSRTGLLHAEPAKQIIRKKLRRFASKQFEGTVSVVFMDLDHFGRINKTYGTTTGDKVLQWFSELIEQETRGTDTLIRWGGEEFVIFALANSKEKQEARRQRDSGIIGQPTPSSSTGTTQSGLTSVLTNGRSIATRIKKALNACPCMVGGHNIKITATLGVASAYVQPGASIDGLFEELMEIADTATKEAKEQDKRNSVNCTEMLRRTAS